MKTLKKRRRACAKWRRKALKLKKPESACAAKSIEGENRRSLKSSEKKRREKRG